LSEIKITLNNGTKKFYIYITKFHPIKDHANTKVEWSCKSTLSLISALRKDGWLRPSTGRFKPDRERSGLLCTGGWMPPFCGRSGTENLIPNRFQCRTVHSICLHKYVVLSDCSCLRNIKKLLKSGTISQPIKQLSVIDIILY